MSVANPPWGAARIHGELLKLGMDVDQTTVAKYMARRQRPPSPGLEDLCSQSRRRHRVDRHVRGADLVWGSVWTSHPAAVTPRASVAGCVTAVCTENLIRVDAVMESSKLAE
jgi:hypothetical protein